MLQVERFFCCLNPSERTILRTTALAFALVLEQGIPAVVFDVQWEIVLFSRDERRTAFEAIYSLERYEAVIEEGGELVQLIRPADQLFWVSVLAFIALPSGACLDGCIRPNFARA